MVVRVMAIAHREDLLLTKENPSRGREVSFQAEREKLLLRRVDC